MRHMELPPLLSYLWVTTLVLVKQSCFQEGKKYPKGKLRVEENNGAFEGWVRSNSNKEKRSHCID